VVVFFSFSFSHPAEPKVVKEQKEQKPPVKVQEKVQEKAQEKAQEKPQPKDKGAKGELLVRLTAHQLSLSLSHIHT
jgi:hypothetical protein